MCGIVNVNIAIGFPRTMATWLPSSPSPSDLNDEKPASHHRTSITTDVIWVFILLTCSGRHLSESNDGVGRKHTVLVTVDGEAFRLRTRTRVKERQIELFEDLLESSTRGWWRRGCEGRLLSRGTNLLYTIRGQHYVYRTTPIHHCMQGHHILT